MYGITSSTVTWSYCWSGFFSYYINGFVFEKKCLIGGLNDFKTRLEDGKDFVQSSSQMLSWVVCVTWFQHIFTVPQHYQWSSHMSCKTWSVMKEAVLLCPVSFPNLVSLYSGKKEAMLFSLEESTSSGRLPQRWSWRSQISNLKMKETTRVYVETRQQQPIWRSRVWTILILSGVF